MRTPPASPSVEVKELVASGLFDGPWYLRHNDDVRADLDPLDHFIRSGWREGRQPNQYFDPTWYLANNIDVYEAGMDPLLHYLRYGDLEGRRPCLHFDPAWYRTAYKLHATTTALAHFLRRRTTGHFAPVPELYAVLHLAPYRDDPIRGEDPFAHYINDTLQAGRDPFPDANVVIASGLIDRNYYFITAADVHEAELDAATHFCRYGWREKRKPNIYFDTRWYLETNPAVTRLQINPLVHYILEGEAANRRPVPYFDPGWYRTRYGIEPGQNALAHYLLHRRNQILSPTPFFDATWYVQQHSDEMGQSRDSFAHFLTLGTFRDIDPSPTFSAARYRRKHLGRPSKQFRHLAHPYKDNPLVHYLRMHYL